MRSFTKTVTQKQLAANRPNAQKSSGPRSTAGKEISSQNRRWHGLAGRFKVLACEDQNAFEKLFDSFVLSEQPVGAAELELVRKMAEYTWLRQRATYFHESCFYVEEHTSDLPPTRDAIRVNPELDKFIRYRAHYDRCYARASAELLRRRKEDSCKRVGSNRRNAPKPPKSAAKNTNTTRKNRHFTGRRPPNWTLSSNKTGQTRP